MAGAEERGTCSSSDRDGTNLSPCRSCSQVSLKLGHFRMHVQSCCFAHQTYCFLTFPLPSSSWFRKVPYAGVMPSLPSLWVDHKKITREGSNLAPRVFSLFNGTCPTSSPSSKYERRRTSALLRNIRNIRICMGKNLSFL